MLKKKFKGKIGKGGGISLTQPVHKKWTVKIGKEGTASITYKNVQDEYSPYRDPNMQYPEGEHDPEAYSPYRDLGQQYPGTHDPGAYSPYRDLSLQYPKIETKPEQGTPGAPGR